MVRVYEKLNYLVHLDETYNILKVEIHPLDLHIAETGGYDERKEKDTGDPPEEAKWTITTGDVQSYLVVNATKEKKDLLFYHWNETEMAQEIVEALDKQQNIIEWVTEPEEEDEDDKECKGFDMVIGAKLECTTFKCFNCTKLDSCGFVEEEYKKWEVMGDGQRSETS
jgi:hypothetical protein